MTTKNTVGKKINLSKIIGGVVTTILVISAVTAAILQPEEARSCFALDSQKCPLLKPFFTDPVKDTVTQYYQEINKGNYQSAWNKLPLNLQKNTKVHPEGFKSFKDFFSSINDIKINSLSILEQKDSKAVVSVDLCQSNKTNLKSHKLLRFYLSQNTKNQQWEISKINEDPDPKDACGSSPGL
jgi:hypothetical protein